MQRKLITFLKQYLDCFEPNWRLMAVTYLHSILTMFCGAYYLSPFYVKKTTFTLVLIIAHFGSPLLALLLSSQTASRLSVIFSEAYRIHYRPKKHIESPSLVSFLFMALLAFLPILFFIVESAFSWQGFFNYLMYNYAHGPLTAVEIIINCLCIIGEQAHVDINHQIKAIKKKVTVKSFFLLKDLIERHLDVQEFVGLFARHFRLHFLNMFLTMMVRLTLYAIWQVGQVTKHSYGGIPAYIFHTVFVTTRLTLVCFRCHRVQEKANETAAIVRRIQVNWLGDLTDDQSELVDYYQQLIAASKVTFTASGLFEISIPQLMNVIGLVITYCLVALQSGPV